MNIAFRKVWRDLLSNRGRTALVTLSIAVGVMALGMTTASNALLKGQIAQARALSHPPHVRLALAVPADDAIVNVIGELPQVDEAEGVASAAIRWKPTLADEWRDGSIVIRADFSRQVFDRLDLRSGRWPADDEIAVEASHLAHYGVSPVGGRIFVRVNDRPVPLRVSGTVHDPQELLPSFSPFNRAAFYVNRNTFQRLVGTRDYTQLRFSLPDYSPEAVRQAVIVVNDRLDRLGVAVAASTFSLDVADPTGDQTRTFIDGLGLVMVTMAALSLGLSITLVVNTINAILAQQLTHIGIMKTIGGQYRQIVSLYLAGILAYGLLSLLIAVPIGAVSAHLLAALWLTVLNVPVAPFQFLPQMVLIQMAVGVGTPLLAALWPILYGVGIPVRQAIAAYGLGTGRYGTGRLDRWMASIVGLPRLAALALRNTFRRLGRVALTELTLIGAGAVFMMVVATSDSFDKTIDHVWDTWAFDVLIVFESFQRVSEIEALILARPEVQDVEMWTWVQAKALRPGEGGAASEYAAQLRGVPDDSQMFHPDPIVGRLLDPADGRAVVMNQKLAQEMGLTVGDEVVLDLGNERQSLWTIVGTVSDIGAGGLQDTAFMRRTVLNAALRQSGRATVAQIDTVQSTFEDQERVKKALQAHFDAQGIRVTFSIGQMENRRQATALFGLISGVLQLMTFLMAAVGSIGLSGTLSINVLERRREIGVMRAVGASSPDVALIFAGEGLLLGVLSWLVAVPLSMLGAQFFVQALGQALNFPFTYQYSPFGALLWLAIIVVLSLLASWLPARRATQISVRESLAYE